MQLAQEEFWHFWFLIWDTFPELHSQIQTEELDGHELTPWQYSGSNEFAYKLWFLLIKWRCSEQCSAPDCTNTWSGAERKFRFCAGCGRASYCSSKCQTSAWQHPDLPHKMPCRALSSMIEAGILKRRTSQDTQEVYFAECHERLQRDGQYEKILKSIILYIEGLLSRKMDALGTVFATYP